jgi:hypothetical protein
LEIGDSEFQRSVLEKDLQNRLALARYKKQGITLEDVLKVTAEKMDVDTE